MTTRKYRSAVMLIQSILEELIKAGRGGMVKTQIYKNVGIKTVIGEKYIEQLVSAGYINVVEEPWGKERVRMKVHITPKGEQRFTWFMQLSNELEM
ncbi:winged helix-turn-helix domain-containing protein [Candidatus Harpocratesius sp.]